MNNNLKEALKINCNTAEMIPKEKIILVFDTETSGLFPKSGASIPITDYPYVLQLSFVLYDISARRILYQYNKYIRPLDNIVISHFITNLTGITREICDSKGVSIIQALQELYRAYKLCDTIVAHNISFDIQMIEIEIIRNYSLLSQTVPMIAFMFNDTFNRLEKKRKICTMAMGKNKCNIMMTDKNGNAYKKNPKLEELYTHLFGEPISNAHDAFYDTMACLRCFIKLQYDITPTLHV